MPEIDDIYSTSKYLKAADLVHPTTKKPVDVPVIIEQAPEQEFKNQNGTVERKIVLYFRGKEKGLPLNKTNVNTCAMLLGSRNSDHWVGKQVILFQTVVESPRGFTPAIRIRGSLPGHETAAGVGYAAPGGIAGVTNPNVKRSVVTQDDPRTTPGIEDDELRQRFELNDEVPF